MFRFLLTYLPSDNNSAELQFEGGYYDFVNFGVKQAVIWANDKEDAVEIFEKYQNIGSQNRDAVVYTDGEVLDAFADSELLEVRQLEEI